MADTQPPRAVGQPWQEPARTKTSPEMRAAKRGFNIRTTVITIASVLGLGGGGYVGHNSADKSTHERTIRLEAKLDEHIMTEKEKSEDLKKKIEKMDKHQSRTEQLNGVILDALRVPKSKRPAEIEEE